MNATDAGRDEAGREIRFHFAGINGRDLAAHAAGQDVLVSYADLRNPGCWAWMRPLLEGGHFRTAILDSGAFTVYAAQQRAMAKGLTREEAEAKAPTITVDAFASFAVKNAHLFTWIANMDDIGGRVEVSNSNFELLEAAGLRGKIVPVWHEGEGDEQLAKIIAQARRGAGRLAVGMQRPKGSLVPTNVVACLREVMPKLAAWAPDVKVHGFGLTRYATEDAPCGAIGWAFDSVDSTTWIAEGCALQRSGACGTAEDKPGRIAARARALRVTVDSYQGVRFVAPLVAGLPRHGQSFDRTLAIEARGQAKTVACRL